jgi:hypothetical protein
MTLSDTQLLILSAASQRTDHAVILPANLKGSAAKKVIDRLLKQKLLQELRAKDDMPVWRRGEDNTARQAEPGPSVLALLANARKDGLTPEPPVIAFRSTRYREHASFLHLESGVQSDCQIDRNVAPSIKRIFCTVRIEQGEQARFIFGLQFCWR